MHIMITGASKGIGLATALRFADASRVAGSARPPKLGLSLCSRHETELADARKRLKEAAPEVEIFTSRCDVSQPEEVRRFVDEAERTFGAIDVLVNNAGFGIFRPVTEMSVEAFNSVMATNLRGVFLITHAVLPGMRNRKLGTIVTVCSVAGKQGYVRGSAYCASKYGVRGLMQSLALEVRTDGIRVVTLFPGNVNTGFFMSAGIETDTSQYVRAEDVAAILVSCVDLPGSACISELEIRPAGATA